MSLDPITAGLDLATELVKLVESFKAGETTPEETIAAARKALGVDPLAGMSAEDAARHQRILGEMAAAARTLRAAVVPPAMLSPDLAAAITALVDHHDPSGKP